MEPWSNRVLPNTTHATNTTQALALSYCEPGLSVWVCMCVPLSELWCVWCVPLSELWYVCGVCRYDGGDFSGGEDPIDDFEEPQVC